MESVEEIDDGSLCVAATAFLGIFGPFLLLVIVDSFNGLGTDTAIVTVRGESNGYRNPVESRKLVVDSSRFTLALSPNQTIESTGLGCVVSYIYQMIIPPFVKQIRYNPDNDGVGSSITGYSGLYFSNSDAGWA